ncbi:HNH endonuclease [Aurantiacibacter flavus]|uniref:HNH endonuclease n=1 Tax=Aurantiacibacter flavus TaxID=3145232 RepID=A0ABV0CVV7_9SPHN
MAKKSLPRPKDAEEEQSACWLCGRSLGHKVQQHHLVPKAKKGKATVPVQPICHRAIHAHATNGELARMEGSHAELMQQEGIARFVGWVADKPPDFYAPTRRRRQG